MGTNMASNQNTALLKVTQLSKDLNVKRADLTEMMGGKGPELKSGASISPDEFELIFETVTKKHQIDNIEDYLDGITYIPSKKKAAPKVEEAPRV